MAKFDSGQAEVTVPVAVKLPKAGIYTCKASVGGVTSNTAVVQVKPYTAATALLENLPGLTIILIILGIVLVVVAIVYLIRRMTAPTLRIRIE